MTIPPVLFADASFYIALLSRKDRFHARAVAWHDRIAGEGISVVTTTAVLCEWLDFFVAPPGRQVVFRAYSGLIPDPLVEVVAFGPEEFDAAIRLYGSRMDKAWSVEDCFSFLLMRERELTAALTADRHFGQAGFSALLHHEPTEA